MSLVPSQYNTHQVLDPNLLNMGVLLLELIRKANPRSAPTHKTNSGATNVPECNDRQSLPIELRIVLINIRHSLSNSLTKTREPTLVLRTEGDVDIAHNLITIQHVISRGGRKAGGGEERETNREVLSRVERPGQHACISEISLCDTAITLEAQIEEIEHLSYGSISIGGHERGRGRRKRAHQGWEQQAERN